MQNRRQFMKTGVSWTALAGGLSIFGPGVFAAADARAETKPLIIAAPATPQSLDTDFDASLATQEVIGDLYGRLFAYDKIPDPDFPSVLREDTASYPDLPGGLKLVGNLAESWEFGADGTWLEVKLRQGVKSNWGNELTSGDVTYTWERRFALGAIGAFFGRVMGLTAPDQVVAVDKYTVRFALPKPEPLLARVQIHLFAHIFDSVKCKQMATADDPWARNFLATNSAGHGPYKIQNFTRGQQMVLEARDDYWGEPAPIKTIVYKEIPTSASRASLLQGGAVDLATALQPLEIESLKRSPGVVIEAVTASQMFFAIFNCTVEPFNKPDVRKAMNYAFPQQQVLNSIYRGTAKPLTSVIPPIYLGHVSSDQYKYNLDKAKELLAKAGFPTGFESALAYSSGDPIQEQIAIIFQTSLRSIGIELSLRKIPTSTFYAELSANKHPITLFSDAPHIPDPAFGISLYFQSNSFLNYGEYKNDKIDELLLEASSTSDNAVRLPLLEEAQKIILDESPWVLICSPQYTIARRANVAGVNYYTSNTLRLNEIQYSNS